MLDNTLLIAFATTSKQLYTVRALIDWNQPKIEKATPAQLPVQPQIKTRHLAVTSWLHDGPGTPMNASHMESSMNQLSRLEFLPPCPDANNRLAPPTIVTFRSHLPISSSHYNQDVHTTIDRWEVREKTQTIHPAFEQLSSRRNSVGSQPGVSLASLYFIIVLTFLAYYILEEDRELYGQQDCSWNGTHASWQNYLLCI